MKPEALKIKVGTDEVEEVFKLILANQHNIERSLYNEFVLLSQNYFSLQKEKKRNTITTENSAVRNNQIIEALLGYIEELPPNLELKIATPQSGQQLMVLELDRALKEFSYEFIENLKKQIAQFAGISPNQIVIIGIREGSLIIRAILPNKAAFYLLRAFRKNPAHQFFKSLKAQSVRVVYTSPLGYLAHLWYKARAAVNYRPALYILAAVAALALIGYGLFHKPGDPASTQRRRLLEIQKSLIENNSQVMKASSEYEALVQEARDLYNRAQAELDVMQSRIDSLGEQTPLSFSKLLPVVQEMDQNALAINEKIDTLNAVVEQYFNVTEEMISLAPKSPNYLGQIEEIRAGQRQIRNKLNQLNTSTAQLKGNTIFLIETIRALAKKRQNEEGEALKYACNTTIEHLNAIGELRVI